VQHAWDIKPIKNLSRCHDWTILTASDATISGHYVRASRSVGINLTSPQIAHVGKNVGTCLEGGGATVKDIIFTVGSVTATADFERYADLRVHYLGPASPKSTTVSTPQLSSPDYLSQVEAFAAIK
jgi:enamine deaminase RidA (YjgF/YER057c/UK114 family)